MQGLIGTAVRRRVTVFMAALAVVAFGIVGYRRLSLELFPDIAYPSLTIQTDFPDTAPQEVENLVTRPVEEAVGVLRGLQTIHSVSRAGVSEVTLEFAWGTDMDMMSMEVRDRLDRLILPDGTEPPLVLRYDPSLDPIVRLALTGPGEGPAALAALRRLAERQLKQDLETIPGIAAAEVKGGYQDEIRVDVDQERLAALGIPLARVAQAVGAANINLPGGLLRGREGQFLIRTVNEYRSPEEIARVVVAWRDGAAVRLGDVADVSLGVKERDEITRVDGRESIEIALYKEGDANTVTVAQRLRRHLDRWRGGKLPPGDELTVLFDQSRFIARAVAEVRNAALLGGALAILVLLLFLRDGRSTVIIAVSIPLSVVATFIVMYRLGISLNIMSLGGLTLGIGMLVDNSIVVLESIFRRRQQGLPLARAAVAGTAEVGPAVVASTLTSVAVFLPIVFVEGIAGQLFRDQALTVTVSLLASLAVALTVVPMLSALGAPLAPLRHGGGAGGDDTGDTAPDPVGTPAALGAVSRLYDSLLRGAIGRKGATLLAAAALLALTVGAARRLETELIPDLSEGEFFFEVDLPEGTPLAVTDRVVRAMEREADRLEGIAHHFATVGSRLAGGGVQVNTRGENLAQVNFVMADRGDDAGEARAAMALRQRFADLPDLRTRLGRPAYFTLKTPVEIDLFGENLESLRDYSLQVAEALRSVPGLVDVRSSLEAGNPEVQVVFDRERLAALGLDPATLAGTLRDRIQGAVPTRFKQQDRQIDIRVRNREDERRTLADVRSLVLPGPDGKPLRLATVAEVRLARGPAEIHRLQQQRAALVTANLDRRSLGAAMADVMRVLRRLPPPPGITVEPGGQEREMRGSFASLRFAILLAVFLVYLVMASTFESFLHPLVVLLTIPLALVGVVAALLLTGTTVSVIVLIGAVMLVGIVVNNAIVLIDTVNRLRRGGLPATEAVIQAGHIRLRPILMTTLTTVLGLLPMALSFGEGAELRSPLAITVAGGLLLSTLLTLVVIPVVYLVAAREG